MISFLSWSGFFLTLINIILLGQKKIIGWPLGILGNICWIIVYWNTNLAALTLNIILLLLSLVGWNKWANSKEPINF